MALAFYLADGYLGTSRVEQLVARWAHIPEAVSSSLTPVTMSPRRRRHARLRRRQRLIARRAYDWDTADARQLRRVYREINWVPIINLR